MAKAAHKEKKPDGNDTAVQDVASRIKSIVKSVARKFGDETVTSGSIRNVLARDVIPTGSILVDVASGIGGVPLGRILEIFGEESSGKTTLTLSIIANAQKAGHIVAFIDAEQSLDVDWAKKLGVDVDDLIISQPNSIEQALEITKALVEHGVKLVVFDSVAAAPTAADLAGQVGDATIGVKARIMSKTLPVLSTLLNRSDATVIFINQVREKVGVMYGDPSVTPGGKSLKFFASMRIRLSRKKIDQAGERVGDEIVVNFVKNKLAPPFKKATVRLIYGKGFDRDYELVKAASDLGVVQQRGAWYYFGDEKFQGQDSLVEAFRENDELRTKIEDEVYAKLRGEPTNEAN